MVAVLIDPASASRRARRSRASTTPSMREALLSAKSAVTQAQLAADIAKREAGRSEKLLAAGAIAENALEVGAPQRSRRRRRRSTMPSRGSRARRRISTTP